MDFKETYSAICKILKGFEKKNYFTEFSSADLFLLEDEKNKCIFSFMEQIDNDSFGCQLFFTKEGFNFIHDVFTINDEEKPLFFECDSICCVIVDKEKLTEKNRKFLAKNKIRVNKRNVFLYRLQRGYGERDLNSNEMELFKSFLEYLNSVIENEYSDVVEAFKKNLTPYAKVNTTTCEYQFKIQDLPFLETFNRKSPVNQGFVDEFNDCFYNDDEYDIFTSYLPSIITPSNIRPLLIVIYCKKENKYTLKYLISDTKDNKKSIFSILYDVFKTDGVPTKIVTNNRELYSHLYKTLEKLNIEYKFKREIESPDYIIKVMSSLFFKITSDSLINASYFDFYFVMAIKELKEKYLDDDTKIVEERLHIFDNILVS